MSMGLNFSVFSTASMRWRTISVASVQNLHLFLAALAVSDDPPPELVLHLVGFLLVAVQDGLLVVGDLDVVNGHGEPGLAGVLKAQVS